MLWSPVSIPGKPTILIVDGSRNLEGWEYQFSDRLYSSMRRRGLLLKGDAPLRPGEPNELATHLGPQAAFNCILLFCHGEGEGMPAGSGLSSYWTWLNSQAKIPPQLFAACTFGSFDVSVSKEILESEDCFAPLRLAPQSPLSRREAGLFFLKFFTELNLHSDDTLTGKMVWFSWSKARELLKRRRLTGQVGVRC